MPGIQFTLNGTPKTVDVREGATLLELLREGCGVTSAKDGCAPEGSCGACTVMVEGRAVVACAQPAVRAAGRSITTQEGLSADERERWAHAFVAAGASQCGFCSPGIVMKAESLIAKNPEPSRDDVLRALAGNLCRCTGYVKIVDAVQLAARAKRGEPLPELDLSGRVGSRTARYLGKELALGDKPYVADMKVPEMLHGALRFSDHPRATVRSIDTSKAQAHPGVVAVVTWEDVPGERVQGAIHRDWPQFVAEGEQTRYVGDVLAAVAAESRVAAREAAALVEVEYEVLEPVTDPLEAMREDAPKLHPGGNVLSVSKIKRGDVDAAVAGAAHAETRTFQTQFIEHAFLEPESSLAIPEPDQEPGVEVQVFSQGQGMWEDRRQVASFLGVDEGAVRVTLVQNGGAFGAKEDLNVQCHSALLALRTGRPVLTTLTRTESMRFHAKRHPIRMEYTVACSDDGKLLAIKARMVGDTGAYASVGDKVLERAAGHGCSVYACDNVDIEAACVYTNNPPCGAMRGFGSNQANFAIEGMMDVLAEEVGIDAWEMRWRNAVDVGDRFGTGQILGPGVGIRKTLEAVKDAYQGARAAGRAVGLGCGAKNTGVGNGLTEYGKAILRPEADGSITLMHSWTEMGQGCHTVLTQMLCEELGLTADRVHPVVDTMRELDTGQTTASRSTVLGGRAVIEAAAKLKADLGMNGEVPAELAERLAELAGNEYYGEAKVDTTFKPGHGPDGAPTHFAYGWATQMVVLDTDGRIEKVVAAHDVGRVINPTLLEGQIEGAIHMGLGQALTEEFVVSDGHLVTDTLKSLHIIPPQGMPAVECVFVEVPQPEGPYGAKGVGEIALVPTASAVAQALYEFDGVRRTSLPMRDSPAARAAHPRMAAVGAARNA
jgi:selenium-dependent xanthine dehydrogenase